MDGEAEGEVLEGDLELLEQECHRENGEEENECPRALVVEAAAAIREVLGEVAEGDTRKGNTIL